MAKSNIDWTDHTWNPWQGCLKVSAGCDHCYMYRDKKRFGQEPSIIKRSSNKTFNYPLTLKDPAFVFTCSWSDFFIEHADEWRKEAWDIIKATPHLTYFILTKRPENIKARLPKDWGGGYLNVVLGVTAENQEQADKRIPLLLQTPAAKRFVSIEPMLGTVDIIPYCGGRTYRCNCGFHRTENELLLTGATINNIRAKCFECGKLCKVLPSLDWVILGGESGPGARPMHPDWARSIRDQCKTAGVPFFFKQWGEWGPEYAYAPIKVKSVSDDIYMYKVGKKKAGAILDGKEYKEILA